MSIKEGFVRIGFLLTAVYYLGVIGVCIYERIYFPNIHSDPTAVAKARSEAWGYKFWILKNRLNDYKKCEISEKNRILKESQERGESHNSTKNKAATIADLLGLPMPDPDPIIASVKASSICRKIHTGEQLVYDAHPRWQRWALIFLLFPMGLWASGICSFLSIFWVVRGFKS